MAQDYYAALGVARDASPTRSSGRTAAWPANCIRMNPDAATQERFKEVTAAYEVLSDSRNARSYDLGGDPLSSAGAGFGAGFRLRRHHGRVLWYVGRSRATPATASWPGCADSARRGARRGRVRRRPRDLQVETAVLCPTCTGAGTAPGTSVAPATSAAVGARSSRSSVPPGSGHDVPPVLACSGFGTVIPHPCPECAGDGRIRTRRTLTVKIPAGVDTGTRIQLAGEGEIGPGGGPAGDLFVEIVELPHPLFQRRGDDLHCTVTLPMTAAALGRTITLETLDGAEEIDIRPGTQSGQCPAAWPWCAAPARRWSWRFARPRRGADAHEARRRAGAAAAPAG